MSSASSIVTYTSVYTDSEPGRVFWGADEELSDEGSPRVIVYRYDGLPMLPVAPPSPDYIPGPEEPQTPPAPQDEDEHELVFIQLHDPNFDPEEYEDDETEDGLVNYPMDGGDYGDDDDGISFGYDADDEDEDEDEEAYAAREAWAHSVGLSQTVHHELQTLREQVYAQEYQLQTHQTQLQLQSTLIQTQQQLHETHSQIQQTEMAVLRETDRAELLALRGQPRRARQPGGDVRVSNHQDAPRDADSHI
nr:hypothetical protein [Tanacetum cinerariifolium]